MIGGNGNLHEFSIIIIQTRQYQLNTNGGIV